MALVYDVVGSAATAVAYDDWVRHGDAASLRVGTRSTDNACGDAGSIGVGSLGKEDAGDPIQDALPPVACVASQLLWWVELWGSWLRNILSMDSIEMKLWKWLTYAVAGAINVCMLQVPSMYAAAGAKVVEWWKDDVAETATDMTPEILNWHG